MRYFIPSREHHPGHEFGDTVAERDWLLNREPQLDTNLLDRLGALSNEADTQLAPDVALAREQLRAIFERAYPEHGIDMPLAQFLREHGVTVHYYGSMQYNDPNTLDADVAMVGNNPELTAKVRQALGYEGAPPESDHFWWFNTLINEEWQALRAPEGRDTGADDHVYDLSSFETVEQAFAEDPSGLTLTWLASVISGKPLFEEDAASMDELRDRAAYLAENDPLLCALTNEDLERTLAVRLRRRGL